MRVLQDLVLLSLLLLSISKVYSQEDKKTKELFKLETTIDIIIVYYQKTVILLHTYLCLPYFAGIKIPFMLTLVLKQDL